MNNFLTMFKLFREKIKKIKEAIKKKSKEKVEEKKVEKKKKVSKKKKGLIEKIKKKIAYKVLEEKDLLPILEDFEIDLIEADCAFEVAEKIKENLLNELKGKEIKKGKEDEMIKEAIRKAIDEILDVPKIDLIKEIKNSQKPYLIVFLGFNGSGKTTTIAKIANFLIKRNFSVVFAAADTFRAASLEQIEEHAKNLGVKVIKQKYGADPAAVVYDAMNYAKSKGIDVVLADTAGRTHTNENLMEELKKIVRVNKPNLKVLVLDSLAGNDIVEQAKAFDKEVGVDVIVFTKLDVNEKGGNILSVCYLLKKPILFFGTGQSYDDLEEFSKEKLLKNFVE